MLKILPYYLCSILKKELSLIKGKRFLKTCHVSPPQKFYEWKFDSFVACFQDFLASRQTYSADRATAQILKT